MVRLERLGIPTAAVATEPFIDEALEQARMLGMPGYRMVFVGHPVQLLTAAELDAEADRVFGEIVARLTHPVGDERAAAELRLRAARPADAARRRS